MTNPPKAPLIVIIEKVVALAEAGEALSLRKIRNIAGRRMAGALLFFIAMVVVSPLSLVPTLPTTVAVIVIMIAGQLVFGRTKIWLPKPILNASMPPERALKVVEVLRPAAGWIGRFSKPRLTFLVSGPGVRVGAAACVLVALTMPPLEFFPGASTSAGVFIAAFGLSLTMQDGALLLLSTVLVVGIWALVLGWIF